MKRVTILTFNGESHSLREWSALTGLPLTTLKERFRHDWEAGRLLTEPKNKPHIATFTKHGHATRGETPTYRSWHSMNTRCLNPKKDNFAMYGGRGISVCAPWYDFKNFLRDMGERLSGTTLERIESNGNYEPGNCRWATPKEQSNNSRKNVILRLHGISRNIAQWSDVTGLSHGAICARIRMGWPIERILTQSKVVGRPGPRER